MVYYGINFYYRNSNVTLYNLYKNILITFPIIAYGPLSILSSTYIYETWVFQFFNIFFSSLPIILFGLFNIKYSEKDLQNDPRIYEQGQQSKFFNNMRLLRQAITTCLLGLMIVYVVFFCNEVTLLGEGYMSFEIWSGMLIFNIVVLSVNVRIYMLSNQISIALVVASLLSTFSYYLIFFFVEIILYSDCKNVLKHQLSNALYWLLVTPALCLVARPHLLHGGLRVVLGQTRKPRLRTHLPHHGRGTRRVVYGRGQEEDQHGGGAGRLAHALAQENEEGSQWGAGE